jgi:hypothetical protein
MDVVKTIKTLAVLLVIPVVTFAIAKEQTMGSVLSFRTFNLIVLPLCEKRELTP